MFSVSLEECWFVPAGDWEARNWRERRHQQCCRWKSADQQTTLQYIELWNNILQGGLLIRVHLAIYYFNVDPDMIDCKVDPDRQTTLQNIVECEVKLCWIWICKMPSGNTSLQHQPGGNIRPQKIINLSLSKIVIKIQMSDVTMYGLKQKNIFIFI